ncbi:unnamed protein product [Urochloa humidicola]
MSKRVDFVKGLIREVAGFAPYEKRITELLKSGKDKHALKVAKRKLGTHKRAKKKINEMANVFRKKRKSGASLTRRILPGDLQGWADLPEELLHSFMSLMGLSLSYYLFLDLPVMASCLFQLPSKTKTLWGFTSSPCPTNGQFGCS